VENAKQAQGAGGRALVKARCEDQQGGRASSFRVFMRALLSR